MFEKVICPDPAYEQLEKSGIARRILEKGEEVGDVFLFNCLGDCDFEVDRSGSQSDKTILDEDLMRCKIEYDDSEDLFHDRFESFLFAHPVYLGNLVLGDDLLRHEDFGFGKRSDLEMAITSFCLGEKHKFRCFSEEWVWRNNGLKNNINRNMHGDLYVSQTDSSGRDYVEKTLFGDARIFYCSKNVEFSGFGAYQDWSEFLGSLLKYSEKVGMSGIDEIVNWRGVLEGIGGGTSGFYTEAFGILSSAEHSAHMLMEGELMGEDTKLESLPIFVHNRDSFTVPYFKGENLLYLGQNKNGDGKFDGKFFEGKRFSKVVEYGPRDLPHAMKGCLKYFARSREMIPAIINEFLKK